MDHNVYCYKNGIVLPVPHQKNTTLSPYLKKIATLLQNNCTTMDELAKTPVTKQDLLVNAVVTPL